MYNTYAEQTNRNNSNSTTEEQTETTNYHPNNTAAGYIFNSMIPPTVEQNETIEALPPPSIGKRGRLNTAGSNRSGCSQMSMDLNFLRPEDVALDGMGLSSSDFLHDSKMPIQSSDFVQNVLLPDAAATATMALKAEQPITPNRDGKPPTYHQTRQARDDHKFCPVAKLTSKLERISTGDSIAPLNENFRLSSKEWVKDFEDDAKDLGAMHPSLFMDPASNNQTPRQTPSSSPKNYPPGNPNVFEEYQVPIQPLGHHEPLPSLSDPNIMHNLPEVSAITQTGSPSSSTTGSTKKRKKKRRDIDESRVIEPTDDDVLFGRGGYTNSHPGNMKFRNKALELRPWYESSSKEEKYNISELLLESVKSEGHRFLEKGSDGLWHEVIGNGARKKASQALRERLKGTRRSTTKRSSVEGGNAHSSSITSVKSNGSSKRGKKKNDVHFDDGIGDILPPADVVGI